MYTAGVALYMPENKKGVTMGYFISFIIGALCGVFSLALLQINRKGDDV